MQFKSMKERGKLLQQAVLPLLMILTCSIWSNTILAHPLNFTKDIPISEYKKSKIILITNDGHRIKGFLVDAGIDSLKIVTKKLEVADALNYNCSNCQSLAFTDLKKIKIKKSFGLGVVGALLGIGAILFVLWIAAVTGSSISAGSILIIGFFASLPLLLLNYAVSPKAALGKKITSDTAVLSSYLKSKSLKATQLKMIFNESKTSEIDLLRLGYFYSKKQYAIIQNDGKFKKGYLVAADEENLYYVTKKKHINPAFNGDNSNFKSITISSIRNIK